MRILESIIQQNLKDSHSVKQHLSKSHQPKNNSKCSHDKWQFVITLHCVWMMDQTDQNNI